MTIKINAIYEGGVLKPMQPLPFAEHQQVQVVVEDPIVAMERLFGVMTWTGDPEALRRLAEDDTVSIAFALATSTPY